MAIVAPPALACTQTESEDKIIEVIYALTDLLPRNPEKAGIVAQKFRQALADAKKPTSGAQAAQAAIDKLCKDTDEILAELRR